MLSPSFSKPLIYVCYTLERDNVLIVEVSGKPRLEAIQRNAFGIAFRNTHQTLGISLGKLVEWHASSSVQNRGRAIFWFPLAVRS